MQNFTCEQVLKTLSRNRNEKDLEKIFNIRYTTANNWKRIDYRDPADGYMRLIVEYLKRVNFVEMNKLLENVEADEISNEFSIASILKMPAIEVQRYMLSLVPWKRECIGFLMSINQELLRAQKEMLIGLLDAQRVETLEDEGEMLLIRESFLEPEKPVSAFKLNREQIRNPKAPPTKEQLQAVSRIAALKGKIIPPKVRNHADRLERWSSRISLLKDLIPSSSEK